MRSPQRGLVLNTSALLLVSLALAQQSHGQAQLPELVIPADDIGVRTLELRRDLQLRSRERFEVDHDFLFEDRLTESGITFKHKVTEDNTRAMKPTHYDHGNGLAVADVDGDGLYDIYFLTQLGGNELWKNEGDGRIFIYY